MMISQPLGAWTNPLERIATSVSTSLTPSLYPQPAVASGSSSSPSPAAAGPVARLQNALVALGAATGDRTLSRVGIDNIAGPGTTKAVNYAIAQRYVVMPSFPRPELTVQHVRQFAGGIAAAVEQAVRAKGGVVPPVQITARARAIASLPISFTPQQSSPSPGGLPFDQKYIFWGVGGFAILLILSMAAHVAREPRRRMATAEA